MPELHRTAAVDAIRNLKARYWRGVDTGDGALVRSILHEDCVLDFTGCCTDPTTGIDHFPAMNVILRGRDSWKSTAFSSARIVSVHQGHHAEIEVLDDGNAEAIWAFTDHFFYPPGGSLSTLVGHGFYHETYQAVDDVWALKTLRIERLAVMASAARN